jgi:LacI family transcriptional regulator
MVRPKSTIYEVARRSGVSTATVSRVMQSSTGFSAETKQRVLRAAGELGWVPSGTARALAARRVGVVGLIFSDLATDAGVDSESPLFVHHVIRGAERVATLAGEAVLIASTRSSGGRELALRVAGQVDGLVVAAPALSERDIAELARSIPVVVIAARPARRTYDIVCADNRGGSATVTGHLIDEHGYRDVVFVAGPKRSPDSRERFAGFRDALAAAGRDAPDAPAAHGNFTETGGAQAMRDILASHGAPDAVVFGNDEMAIGALAVLRQHKLRTPGDVAVTGFDDIASARHVSPSLTTVRQPMGQLGEEAVRAVFARIADPTGRRGSLTLATDLTIRRSCGCRGARRAQTQKTAESRSS